MTNSMDIRPLYGEKVDQLYQGFEFNNPKNKPKPGFSWIILGASGAGKESRGKYLLKKISSDEKNAPTKLSSGDIFRNQILGGIKKEQADQIKEVGRSLGDSLRERARDYKYIFNIFNDHSIKYGDAKQAVAAFQTLNGLFVDDAILLEYAENQLKEYGGKRVVLDGHIRTEKQVPGILNLAKKYDINVGYALLVHTPLLVLEERTAGRLSCPTAGCKRDYNTTAPDGSENYPYQAYFDAEGLGWGQCHDHKVELVRRTDDYPEKVKTRLNEYKNNIPGVLKKLKEAKVPIFIVSGYLNPYSKEEMQKSVDEALNCENQKVMERFLNTKNQFS